jgi:hypothetical protein
MGQKAEFRLDILIKKVDVWAEYLTMAGKENCNVETRPSDDAPHAKAFIVRCFGHEVKPISR